MTRECIECGVEFNTSSPRKKAAGGRINQCPDCSDEHVVRYLGVQNAAGKMSGCEILSFKSEADRSAFNDHWRNNSGMHRGKACQLGSHTTAGSGSFQFKRVAEFGRNDNHKGRGE